MVVEVFEALDLDKNGHGPYGNVISVTMPGSAQLDGITRYRLAAQVAATFALVTGSTPIRLLDGGRALVIPNYNDSQFSAGNTQFSASDFATQLFPAPASAAPSPHWAARSETWWSIPGSTSSASAAPSRA